MSMTTIAAVRQGPQTAHGTSGAGDASLTAPSIEERSTEKQGLKRPSGLMDGAIAFDEPCLKKARVDSKIPDIWSAIGERNEGAVRALLQARAVDLSHRDKAGLTPLLRAIDSGSLAVVETIWQAMSDSSAHHPLQVTGFLHAIKISQFGIVRRLLELAPGMANACEPEGGRKSALHLACGGSDASLVNLLMSWSASHKAVDAMGNTPFIQAAISDQPGVLAALHGWGAALQATNLAKRTALGEAMLGGSHGAVEALLQRGVRNIFAAEVEVTHADWARMDGFALDIFDSAAELLDISAAGKQTKVAPLTLPSDAAAWFKQLAEDLLPLNTDEDLQLIEMRAAPLLRDRLRIELKTLHATVDHFTGFPTLCAALAWREVDPAAKKGLSVQLCTPAQREQAMFGLLAKMSGEVEGERILASQLSDGAKRFFLPRLKEELESLRPLEQGSWKVQHERLAGKLSSMVLNHISIEREFKQDEMRSSLARKYGLFQPVIDLLLDATATALARMEARAGDLPAYGTRRALQEALGRIHRERFPAAMATLLQQYEDDLLHWKEDLRDEKPCRYQVPQSFRLALRAGQTLLVLAQSGARPDAYVDLVFAQWNAVRRALLSAWVPGFTVQEIRFPGTVKPVPQKSESEVGASSVAVSVYSAELDMDFELGPNWDLEI